jgi:hypothetical protein
VVIIETVVLGVDFAGCRTEGQQRRKIIAIEGKKVGSGRYSVVPAGLNARLAPTASPGWTAEEFARTLAATPRVRVAADFPFALPEALLLSQEFSALSGRDKAFRSWIDYASFLSGRIPLAPPIDLDSLRGWKDPSRRAVLWAKRATDIEAGAHPPLKDRFQVLYNMTLLGAAFLHRLREEGFAVLPFDTLKEQAVLEVYPGLAMRRLGRRDYKRNPAAAISAMIDHCSELGVAIELHADVRRFCESYNTGSGSSPDPDGSDAFIALCQGILHLEGLATEVVRADCARQEQLEGVIFCSPEAALTPARSGTRGDGTRGTRTRARASQLADQKSHPPESNRRPAAYEPEG